MSFSLSAPGGFKQTLSRLQTLTNYNYRREFEKAGRRGVAALSDNTPVETGNTASSWDYTIESSKGRTTISWINTNTNQGANIAILLQYGHGTGTGGWVEGVDYVNPAMRPVFDQILLDLAKAVSRG